MATNTSKAAAELRNTSALLDHMFAQMAETEAKRNAIVCQRIEKIVLNSQIGD